MTRRARAWYAGGLVLGLALVALGLGVVAQAQEPASAPLPIPDGLRGGWLELGITLLDRYWPQIAAGLAALVAGLKGWRPRMPVVTVRLEVHIPEPVAIRHVRVARELPSPATPVAVEDVSDPTPEAAPPPAVPLRDRRPPRRDR